MRLLAVIFAIVSGASSVYGQGVKTIPVVTDAYAKYAHEIFSVNAPKIIHVTKKNNAQYGPSATVEFTGRVQGNLCLGNGLALSQDRIMDNDFSFDSKYDKENYIYSLLTYRYMGRRPIIVGQACTSHGEDANFKMRVTYLALVGIPVRVKIWNIKFDMGDFGAQKKFSKTIQLVYQPTKDKWTIRTLSK